MLVWGQNIIFNKRDKVYLTKNKEKIYTIINCEKNIESEDGSVWEKYIVTLIDKENNIITRCWEWSDDYEQIPIRLIKNLKIKESL